VWPDRNVHISVTHTNSPQRLTAHEVGLVTVAVCRTLTRHSVTNIKPCGVCMPTYSGVMTPVAVLTSNSVPWPAA
jgi:hypothetical protein